MNKKFLLLLSSIIIIFSMMMTGCQPTVSPVEEPTESEETEGVVELVYMRQAEGIDEELKIVEEFNQSHPHIKVIVDSTPAQDHYTKLALTTEAGNPPDVYQTYFTIGAATNGLAMDLTPFIEREGEDFYNSFYEGAWLFNKYAGKYYGIPYRIAPNVVLLNKEVADNAGVEIPIDIPAQNSWTWEEFVEFAKAITDPENGVYGYCLTGSAEALGTDAQFQAFLFSNGGKMINEEGLAGFNSEKGIETLQFLTTLVNESGAVPPGTTSATENICPDLLISGKVGMWIDGSLWEGIIEGGNPGIDLTVLPLPHNGTMGTMDGGTGFGMSAITEHPEEAWEFMKYLASDEVQKRWAMAANWQPGNVAVLNDPEFTAKPSNATVAWIMNNYKITPLSHYPNNAILEAALRTYIQASYLQDMTPQEALEGAAMEWNTDLKKYQNDDWWNLWLD